jgi:hypothetical protein
LGVAEPEANLGAAAKQPIRMDHHLLLSLGRSLSLEARPGLLVAASVVVPYGM